MFKSLSGWLGQISRRYLVYYTCLAVGCFFLFLWRLGSLPDGLSPAEAAARSANRSISGILNDPTNAPQRLLQHLLASAGHGHLWLRLSSAIFAIIFTACFYRLVAHWFGRSIGFFGSVLFVTTPLLVISSRQTSAEIMFLTPLAVMAAYAWMVRTDKYRPTAWITLSAVAALAIYTPGVIWWLLAAVVVCRRKIQALLVDLPRTQAAAGLGLWLVIILPIVISGVKDWKTLEDVALVPRHWPHIIPFIKDVGWMAAGLFARLPKHTPLVLGRLPLLDIAQTALLAFGVYAMLTAAKSKTYGLAAAVGLAVILAGLNDSPAILLLGLPALGIFCSAGLRYLYIEWKGIFPSNPLPKALAILLIAAAVAGHVLYGVRYSLIAWPRTMDTRNTYVLK